MSPILITICILSAYTLVYATAGYFFYSIYRDKFWIALLIIPLVAVPYYYSVNDLYDHFWPGVWAQTVWTASGYLMGMVYTGVKKRSITRLQEARDREAAVIAASLENLSGKHQSFALYLRPFSVTKNIPTSLPGTYYTNSQFEGVKDFEAILENSLTGTMPLVALGRPHETYGAGRIITDDETWKTKIIQLMQAATTIYLIPSDHKGTLWEIQHIYQTNLIEKCIFIMPPIGAAMLRKVQEQDWQYDHVFVDHTGEWATTQTALEKVGIHLPGYQPTGALFTMNRAGEQSSYSPMALLLPKFTGETSYTRSLKKLIDQLQSKDVKSSKIPKKKSRNKLWFQYEADETIYEIRPGGFEINETGTPRSFMSKIYCLVMLILVIYAIIYACRNFRESLLWTAETSVAIILVKICLWPFVPDVQTNASSPTGQ